MNLGPKDEIPHHTLAPGAPKLPRRRAALSYITLLHACTVGAVVCPNACIAVLRAPEYK